MYPQPDEAHELILRCPRRFRAASLVTEARCTRPIPEMAGLLRRVCEMVASRE